jgi:cytochrome c oxidase assembly factor CtaG
VPRWAIVLYLILADVQNTVLCAGLVFAERLIYPSYAAVPPLWGISALNDQAAAGAIMWVPGSIAFLVPIVWIVAQVLGPQGPPAAILSHRPVAVSRLRVYGRGNGAE